MRMVRSQTCIGWREECFRESWCQAFLAMPTWFNHAGASLSGRLGVVYPVKREACASKRRNNAGRNSRFYSTAVRIQSLSLGQAELSKRESCSKTLSSLFLRSLESNWVLSSDHLGGKHFLSLTALRKCPLSPARLHMLLQWH